MRVRSILALMAGVTSACRGRTSTEQLAPTSTQAPTPVAVASAPALPPFEVTSDAVSASGVKRTVEVVLSQRVDDVALRAIANKLKAARTEPVERTFMTYSVAGAKLAGAWATTHFNPNLEVRIIGFTPTEFARLRSLSVSQDGYSEVGAWIDEDLGALVSIHRVGARTILRRDFVDGTHGETPLSVTRVGGQLRLDDIPKSDHGEFYSFAGGWLQYVGPRGVFRTLQPRAPVSVDMLR